MEPVVAGAARDDVAARPGPDEVVAEAGEHDVGAAAGEDPVPPAAGEDEVVAACGSTRSRPRPRRKTVLSVTLAAAKLPRTPWVAELGCRKSMNATRSGSTPATAGFAGRTQSCADRVPDRLAADPEDERQVEVGRVQPEGARVGVDLDADPVHVDDLGVDRPGVWRNATPWARRGVVRGHHLGERRRQRDRQEVGLRQIVDQDSLDPGQRDRPGRGDGVADHRRDRLRHAARAWRRPAGRCSRWRRSTGPPPCPAPGGFTAASAR